MSDTRRGTLNPETLFTGAGPELVDELTCQSCGATGVVCIVVDDRDLCLDNGCFDAALAFHRVVLAAER